MIHLVAWYHQSWTNWQWGSLDSRKPSAPWWFDLPRKWRHIPLTIAPQCSLQYKMAFFPAYLLKTGHKPTLRLHSMQAALLHSSSSQGRGRSAASLGSTVARHNSSSKVATVQWEFWKCVSPYNATAWCIKRVSIVLIFLSFFAFVVVNTVLLYIIPASMIPACTHDLFNYPCFILGGTKSLHSYWLCPRKFCASVKRSLSPELQQPRKLFCFLQGWCLLFCDVVPQGTVLFPSANSIWKESDSSLSDRTHFL